MNSKAHQHISNEEAKAAEIAYKQLKRFRLARAPVRVRARSIKASRKVKEEEEVIIPAAAIRVLMEALTKLAQGERFEVVSVKEELSTQEAADLLNVSRPYLIGLLDRGEIPYRKVGNRRRVKHDDILAYKTEDDKKRAGILTELAAEAQRIGLGY